MRLEIGGGLDDSAECCGAHHAHTCQSVADLVPLVRLEARRLDHPPTGSISNLRILVGSFHHVIERMTSLRHLRRETGNISAEIDRDRTIRHENPLYDSVMDKENVGTEAEYWAARDARDQEILERMRAENARKARQRKTAPWRIAATLVVVATIPFVTIGFATSL